MLGIVCMSLVTSVTCTKWDSSVCNFPRHRWLGSHERLVFSALVTVQGPRIFERRQSAVVSLCIWHFEIQWRKSTICPSAWREAPWATFQGLRLGYPTGCCSPVLIGTRREEFKAVLHMRGEDFSFMITHKISTLRVRFQQKRRKSPQRLLLLGTIVLLPRVSTGACQGPVGCACVSLKGVSAGEANDALL